MTLDTSLDTNLVMDTNLDMDMNYLANINKHERDSCITFKDDGHIYTIKHAGSLEGETGFTSVTTLIHSFVEKFNADKIINTMMKSSNWPNNKYFGMTKSEIKDGWTQNGKDAAAAGTKMHFDIECFYNNIQIENTSIEYSYFVNFENDYCKSLKPYRTEWLIFDEELRLAGSIDMVFITPDGSLEIYDWKRSKEIIKTNKWNKWMNNPIISHLPDTNYWHYSLQLNVYKAILMRKYGVTVKNLYLVCLHPNNNNGNYIRIPVPNLQNEVKSLFLERITMLKNL